VHLRRDGKDQLFTWMAVDQTDGSIDIVFYDRRNLKDTMTGLTLARSIDGGKTFVNYRIDQEPFVCLKDVFMGDYIGISAVGGKVVAGYCHVLEKKQTVLSAAVFQFKLGTLETEPAPAPGVSIAEVNCQGSCFLSPRPRPHLSWLFRRVRNCP